ncbi:MAG: diguanylate cyclase [Anaerolineales bacterium]|nr:diguanylate cyclase [Anaerolineales bacterium]
MNIYFFVFFLFITATITLTFALRSWQKGVSRTIYFSLLLGSLSTGTFSYAMELWGGEETSKFFWLMIKYAGFVLTAVFWLLFTLHFTERRQWLRLPYYVTMAIIPAITFLMLLTTSQTGWMFKNIRLWEQTYLIFDYGPYFWVHTLYMYTMFGLGFSFLYVWFRQKQPLNTLQWIGLVSGISIPFFTNLIVVFRLPFLAPIDLTPLGMALGIWLIGWVLFGVNFSGVNPIARETLIESLKDGVIVLDTHRMITDANPAARHLLAAPGSLIGQPLETAISDPIVLPTLDIADTYPHQEITLPNPGGEPRVLDLRASPLVDKTQLLRGWLLLLRDITEQKKLQNEIKKQSLRNAALAEIELAINQPHELAGVLRKIVDTTYELLPAAGGATILMWDDEARSFEHADSTLPAEDLNHLLLRARQGRGSASWIVANRQPKIVPDTHYDPFGDSSLMVANSILAYAGFPLVANGKIVGVLYANDTQPRAYLEDDLRFLQTLANRAAMAIYRVQQFSQVQQQAITDHLTGILNRRQLFNLGELEFRRARRFNRPLCAILLDIDHFKMINDTYGHAKGDQVLKNLAQFLKLQLREFDILARYGGEEFVIILPGADFANARNIAHRLRKGVEDRTMINGSVSITISLGVAELTEATPDFQALINQADMAMYEAKRAGRNRVAWLE